MKHSKTTTLVLWLSCISLSSSLVASTICRNALYLAAAIALIDFFIKKTKPQLNYATFIVFIVLLLSFSLYLQTVIFSSTMLHEIDLNYREAAKRMFLGTIISIYLISHRDKISDKGWLGAYSWVTIGFIYTTLIAFKLSVPNRRLELKTVATMTAYVFVIISLAATYITLKLNGWYRSISVIFVVMISSYIVLLTQTRSVLLTYPLILLLLLLKEKFFNKQNLVLLAVMTVCAISLFLPRIHTATERLERSFIEYNEYKNNDESTSLGSRFSMWKAGFSIISSSMLGESADRRDALARQYIDNHENGNHEALRVIKYHYHNDLLEAITLRGILGVIILLAFYIFTIYASYRFTGSTTITLLLMAPTLLYGSTDSLLIDHRYVTTLILLLPFYLCIDSTINNRKIINLNNKQGG
ncbi:MULTISPECIES: O-antigen ligase family protein [Erwinia]|uniref:O-antigen ligase family protein n=1 Tax=Erwinia TaxID=551 RepID=UPI00105EE7BF|nr:O-antigen ligase family protein [Erwinia aphidicola]MCP2231334.1 O-antigen ligase [Erwinia aphidicola]